MIAPVIPASTVPAVRPIRMTSPCSLSVLPIRTGCSSCPRAGSRARRCRRPPAPGPAERDERDQRGEDAGGGRTDDRDERRDEHDDREGQCERDADDRDADTDADRVDRGDGGGAADVTAEGLHDAVTDPTGACVALTGERAEQELPDLRAVLEKKNRTTIISTRPVRKFAVAEAPASAPEPNCELVRNFSTLFTTSSICESEIEIGSVDAKSCSCSNPRTADFCRSGHCEITATTMSQPTRPSTTSTPMRTARVATPRAPCAVGATRPPVHGRGDDEREQHRDRDDAEGRSGVDDADRDDQHDDDLQAPVAMPPNESDHLRARSDGGRGGGWWGWLDCRTGAWGSSGYGVPAHRTGAAAPGTGPSRTARGAGECGNRRIVPRSPLHAVA